MKKQGRPKKQGLDMFPLDTGFLNDRKVKKIINDQGSKSVAVLIAVLCTVYKERGYFMIWDDDAAFDLSEASGVSVGQVWDVINKALSVGLFDRAAFEKFRVITSNGIQQRYLLYIGRRAEVTIYPEIWLLDSTDMKVGNVRLNADIKGLFADKKGLFVCKNSINVGKNSFNDCKKPTEERSEIINADKKGLFACKNSINVCKNSINACKKPLSTTTTISTTSTIKEGGAEISESSPAQEAPGREFTALIAEMKEGSPIWTANLCRRFKCSEEELKAEIDDFELSCLCSEKTHTDLTEAKRHFFSWRLKKEDVQAQRSRTENGKPQQETNNFNKADARSAARQPYRGTPYRPKGGAQPGGKGINDIWK